MKIDIHTHILPEALPDLSEKYGYDGWISIQKDPLNPFKANMIKNGRLFRSIDQNCWCLHKRYDEMVSGGVTTQILSTVPVMFNYWAKAEDTLDLCHLLNNDLACQIRKFQTIEEEKEKKIKSFYGFGTVPMQRVDYAIEEMTRCMKDLNFKGIQIGSHINSWNLDAKELYPFWKRAEDLNCPIFVHPWDMDHVTNNFTKYWLPWLVGMPSETTTAICCLLMGNILKLFPRLKICFAHGGGAFPFTIGRIQHGYDVRPDLCATECSLGPEEFLGKFYTDSLVHSKKSLDLLIDVIGEDKVILGSDYPFPLGEHVAGSLVESTDYSDDLKEKLLYKNALEFLSI